MRYFYMGLIALLTAILLLFKFQNLEVVTVSFLSMSVTLPVGILILIIYVMGMITGSALFNLLRSWIHGATRSPQ